MFHITLRPIALALVPVLIVLLCSGCQEDTARDGVSRAQQLKAEHRYGAAIIELKTVLQEQPDFGEARLLLGEIYLDIEDFASAQKELHKARSLGIADDTVIPLLVRALMFQNQPGEIFELEVHEKLSPSSAAVLDAFTGLAYLATQQPDEAENHIQVALRTGPDSNWVRYAYAGYLLERRSHSEAVAVLERLLQDDPHNGLAWSMLAKAYLTMGRAAEGEAAFTEAIVNRMQTSLDRLHRGEARLRQGKLDLAAEDARILLKRNPKWIEAGYFAGKVRFRQKRYREAEQILADTYQLDFSRFQVVFLLARTYLKLNQLGRAEALAESAHHLKPRSPLTRNLLVEIYLRRNKAAKAEELLRPVLAAYPKYLSARIALVESLTQQGKDAEAEKLLQEAFQAAPNDVGARAALAHYYLSRNRAKRAIELLQDGPQDDNHLLFMQADAYARLAQLDKAKKILERVVEKTPTSAKAHYGLARVNIALGNLREAYASFDKARTLERHTPQQPAAQ